MEGGQNDGREPWLPQELVVISCVHRLVLPEASKTTREGGKAIDINLYVKVLVLLLIVSFVSLAFGRCQNLARGHIPGNKHTHE